MSITMNTMIVAVDVIITMNTTIAVVAAVIIMNMTNTPGASC